MSFDAKLVERVRAAVGKKKGVSERPMFGCLGFFLNGNLGCGVHEEEIILRVAPSAAQDLLKRPGVRAFDLAGRVMKGWVLLDPARVEDDEVRELIVNAMKYAASLPEK
jgi:TfoX/Sxy family transcriptional regulator of competence genes